MRVTTADVARFVGGQMEILNPGEGYLYRGELASVEIKDCDLVATFTWSAKGEGYPSLPQRWVKDETLDYAAVFHSVQDIGPSETGTSRLKFETYSGETVLLYPPDGSKLDRSKVDGLDSVPA